MKQFDLQAAMRGEPIVTRGGEPVQFIAYVPGADPQQQLVTLRDGVVSVTGIGGIYWGSGSESSRDLFMAPVKTVRWVNLNADGLALHFRTEDLADSASLADCCDSPQRLGGKAFPVEIEK